MKHSLKIRQDYDVLIIGAGWAGLTLARQIKLENPNLSILQLEASTQFKAKVGEATVEMAGHYFIHRLGLINYLYRNHLPKNGLRFFFDSEQHDLSLHEMSEHGTTSIPPHPAFQLDRAKLEHDLVYMNQEQGIDLLMGAKVKDIQINDNADHHISFDYLAQTHNISARWLVDASGKASLLAKKEKLHHRRDVPKNCAAWARFSQVTDIDSIGPQKWRKMVNGRFLSTIHFTGPGYWIWVIPLSGGFTSIGIDCDKAVMKKPPLKQADFLAFLQQHKGLSELLVNAKLEDFEAWGQLAYRSEQFINIKRWATTGFAAMFLDPLFSGGGDVIAITNDAITNTICADFSYHNQEEADKALTYKVPILNQQSHEFYQGLYAYINNTNPALDCAEICSPLLAYNTAVYFLEAAWDYMAGNFSNIEYWQKKDYIRRGYLALEKILNKQITSTLQTLREQGRYFNRNHEGFFESGADLYKYFVFDMGKPGKDGWRIDMHIKLWVDIYLKITASKLNLNKFASRRLVQETLNLPQILAHETFDETQFPELLANLNQTLTNELQQNTEHTVLAEITRESFSSGHVTVQVIDNTLDDADMNKLIQMAKGIWNTEQEYIAMPFMVPHFLQFCRKTDTKIMSDPIQEVALC
ncbi:NAD(P)/FAD-dependent oxidoreductase [Pseudoalteromonas denitrificans]|uniref:Dehydrogenase (Flavoprotein) n=1 Tax=Pseudoalteromonas denitrificans DSM 6059 TaxID=1123010 RepID=A0A1I1I7I1_9GAMM|nr:tryptophan 7-halogenase [Pseudoalteromonas denitrificans]SFC32124.1 Dehydrogenase (flavoprotein) [Pseudoalteromonas denitrificans DSM 6059]